MPATGYRNRDTGILASVGTHIGFWSSSTDASASAFATYLRYWSGALGPIFGHSRANGFSVRCVQHLQAEFFAPRRSDESCNCGRRHRICENVENFLINVGFMENPAFSLLSLRPGAAEPRERKAKTARG
ncbi:MAG: fibrobacter succinogenes major paralogous domain-containing protein [Alistipes sp.]|nr:fibrobacter succinogenes major paralogous domain-containing protein [Alistipes sp.]